MEEMGKLERRPELIHTQEYIYIYNGDDCTTVRRRWKVSWGNHRRKIFIPE